MLIGGLRGMRLLRRLLLLIRQLRISMYVSISLGTMQSSVLPLLLLYTFVEGYREKDWPIGH